ncbi:crAss001_48 related protein [Edaphocola aurantiacus]|uniref:crAss001_48 related protein n=1 Tax=Edaphocola aurantiacus TaxID=2601682 RepID=UPI001C944615|nr:hypothetical protein [Edaphocola aurantiacus]
MNTENLLPHQQRVVTERIELDEKLHKLSQFLKTDIFQNLHSIEQELLTNQFNAMSEYSTILADRISLF